MHICRSCDTLTAPKERDLKAQNKWLTKKKKSVENLTYEKGQVSHNPHMWHIIII
jgi:hypothetical protein